MSGEVPKAKRVAFDALQPADVVFFGGKGPKSQPTQVDHMGIALGNGWMIHSSRHGVALVALDGWYSKTFAWARRPLAEAGLLPNG
jgi:cell wall-associated NlpC family hydrolase